MTEILTWVIIAQTIRISVPYILASLGGVFSERSGVVNIALEGIMLNGALGAVLASYYAHNAWIGILGGMAAGLLSALVLAIITIRFKADQIVSGVALNLLAVGLTKFILRLVFDSSSNSERVEGLPIWHLPGFAQDSAWNSVLGSPLVLLTLLIIIVSHLCMKKTVFGLRIRAVGEHPAAADSVGINVTKMRYWGVLLSGLLGGLAGTYLALEQHQFTQNMTSGRGYIALAAMIFGKWNPAGAVTASLIFGFAETLNIQFQSSGYNIPNQFIQMIPYILTMIVLLGVIGRSIPPAADGKPYEAGE
jgi:simple sugar transport system permease protein